MAWVGPGGGASSRRRFFDVEVARFRGGQVAHSRCLTRSPGMPLPGRTAEVAEVFRSMAGWLMSSAWRPGLGAADWCRVASQLPWPELLRQGTELPRAADCRPLAPRWRSWPRQRYCRAPWPSSRMRRGALPVRRALVAAPHGQLAEAMPMPFVAAGDAEAVQTCSDREGQRWLARVGTASSSPWPGALA